MDKSKRSAFGSLHTKRSECCIERALFPTRSWKKNVDSFHPSFFLSNVSSPSFASSVRPLRFALLAAKSLMLLSRRADFARKTFRRRPFVHFVCTRKVIHAEIFLCMKRDNYNVF